mmetsp:Transcript_14194/g.26055  ORF Transcript_14194/g.26055 Transcript_14194/m.26055 type:complete len:200 (+) Transcript_14194:485-1084(+)
MAYLTNQLRLTNILRLVCSRQSVVAWRHWIHGGTRLWAVEGGASTGKGGGGRSRAEVSGRTSLAAVLAFIRLIFFSSAYFAFCLAFARLVGRRIARDLICGTWTFVTRRARQTRTAPGAIFTRRARFLSSVRRTDVACGAFSAIGRTRSARLALGAGSAGRSARVCGVGPWRAKVTVISAVVVGGSGLVVLLSSRAICA